MTNRINQLSALQEIKSGDQLPIYSTDNGDTRKVSVNDLAEYIQEGFAVSQDTGGAHTISDITGLQSALDGKEANGTAAAVVAAHEAALDPHPQYTTPAEAAAVAPVQSVVGRTGAVTLAKADVGLSNVDNTADTAKPVSTAQATAISAKMTNPMTATGDIIIGGASGAPSRLAASTDGYVLTLASGSPAWAAAATGGSGGDMLATLLSAEVSVTGAVTLTSSAFGKMHVCTGTTVDYTVGLPAVAGNAGKFIGFRMASALTQLVTLDGNASELIDTALTRVMHDNEVAILLCDGTAWTKFAGKSIPLYATIRLASGTPSTAQSIANGTMTKVLCNQSDASVAGMSDAANKRIYIKRGSTYAVSGMVYISPGFTFTRVISSLQKNSSEIFSGETNCSSVASNPWCQAEGRPVLAAGDYMELYVYQSNTGSTAAYLYGGTTGASNILSVMEIPTW